MTTTDSGEALPIDCDGCRLRGRGCGDCVVQVLLGVERPSLTLEERRAVAALAGQGLVPPLRLCAWAHAASARQRHW